MAMSEIEVKRAEDLEKEGYVRVKAGRSWMWLKKILEPKFVDNYEKIKEEFDKVMMEIKKIEKDVEGVDVKKVNMYGYELKPEIKLKLEMLNRFDKELEKAIKNDEEIAAYLGDLETLIALNENIRTMIECNLLMAGPYYRAKVMKLIIKVWNKIKGGVK